jgi:hypothetical protein
LEKAYKATVPNGNDNDLQPTNIGSEDVTSLEEKKTFLFSLIDEDWSQLRFVRRDVIYCRSHKHPHIAIQASSYCYS